MKLSVMAAQEPTGPQSSGGLNEVSTKKVDKSESDSYVYSTTSALKGTSGAPFYASI